MSSNPSSNQPTNPPSNPTANPPVNPLATAKVSAPVTPVTSFDSTSSITVTRIILRNFSKGIFSYPILIFSLISWIIEYVYEISNFGEEPSSVLAAIWLVFLFGNLFVLCFDITTGKFLIMILLIFAVILLFVVLGITGILNFTDIEESVLESTHPKANAQFYLYATIVFGLIVLLSIINAYFQYVKIEQNEVYVFGFGGKSDRFPTHGMTIKKEIADVFEWIALRAGSLTFNFEKGHTLTMNTVLNIEKKEKLIDELLSTTLVKKI